VPHLTPRTVSKGFAVPGYRLGALVASPTFLQQALKIIDTQTICPSQVVQPAVAWALPNLRQWREDQRQSINDRLNLFADCLNAVPGWKVGSKGGFYVFARHPFAGRTSAEVVKAMILQCGVSALPASFFCPATDDADIQAVADNWMRFSIPNASAEDIREAADRLRSLKLPAKSV
jgi:aspartate/methionine/tyrosine aminotransferase